MSEFPQGPFRITKTIPARTEVIVAEWCKKDWLIMTPTFRAVREKCQNQMTSCKLCGHDFPDGEMMGLACFQKWGNRTVCGACADELLASKESP